ncbi:hypothetical protein P171DRAFT_439399 [Karstenula rhodostoma CBS 690.94]|uniref:Uncharacterized protein n=1 Tax=Karstenula rhodostoma CBS 690.94 TaxID=1392251 RepID=A0A9P4PV29_9PLEO|nr:hypothetical protein P171DRAFT_439399 [Karstenula rhodostoma CBS 690.94]
MANVAAAEHTYLRYGILFTAFIGVAGYISLTFSPSAIRANYTPTHRPHFTTLAARSLGAWFFLCGILRFGGWYYWGERGWYDACMVSLAVPLWHYTVERVAFGSVGLKQVFLAYAIDGGVLVWMWLSRGRVVGL